MFTDKAIIKELVDNLLERQVTLYHACQLVDFESYLQIGGIPSRKTLEESGLPYTGFDTDEIDKKNEVWDKVFVNLQDFGWTFSNGDGATPNTFGPILIKINPKSLNIAKDISITLRSAGAMDFDRIKESLNSIEEVDNLFSYPIKDGFPKTLYIKWKKDLQNDFRNPSARSPEINCTYPRGILPLDYFTCIYVDPYVFSNHPLYVEVNDIIKNNNLTLPYRLRNCKSEDQTRMYSEIGSLLINETPSFDQIEKMNNPSADLLTWINKLKEFKLDWQFKRYGDYLRNGTIKKVLERYGNSNENSC